MCTVLLPWGERKEKNPPVTLGEARGDGKDLHDASSLSKANLDTLEFQAIYCAINSPACCYFLAHKLSLLLAHKLSLSLSASDKDLRTETVVGGALVQRICKNQGNSRRRVNALYIQFLAVTTARELEGSHLGTILLADCLEAAEEKGCDSVVVPSSGASFWEGR